MYFNGEGVQLVHVPKAHTAGDILVFFRSSDVIATGDLFSTTAYPMIDRAAGGHVNGVIEGLNRIIDLAISEMYTEGGTRVVPGRGRICDEFDVVEYRDMVTIVRDRVQAMIKKGMSARAGEGGTADAGLRDALRRHHGAVDDGDVRRSRVSGAAMSTAAATDGGAAVRRDGAMVASPAQAQIDLSGGWRPSSTRTSPSAFPARRWATTWACRSTTAHGRSPRRGTPRA